jgi:hypothetical protein
VINFESADAVAGFWPWVKLLDRGVKMGDLKAKKAALKGGLIIC